MPALLTTSLPNLPAPRKGKVREVYDLGDSLLIVATDRISAFDVVMANGIPDKGRILNQMSAFWFEKFAEVCPNHVISTDDAQIAERVPGLGPDFAGRCTLAKKAEPLPIECVARGYIAGSLFKEYVSDGPGVHGLSLPEGLINSAKLPEPIFTPATKAETGHDLNLSFAGACNIVGPEVAEQARDFTLELYRRASIHAASKGILLADTKFEFGFVDGELTWIDEALTPDSSRFWPAETYEPGRSQPSYDKQFVRDYLETLDWDKRPPGPTLPEDVVAKTRAKYLEAFHVLTGRELRGAG
ncbi:MAG: phosphoribosylaminoimidazolesuccinocarboxamide synthase [Armatimonadetes bacterium]|nr:phosphoribosylaminoimidazolesuccinocarboxamide synthase [Armatimonadota bacterium]